MYAPLGDSYAGTYLYISDKTGSNMKYLIFILTVLILGGCQSTSQSNNLPIEVDFSNTSSDPEYGLSESKPVMLGGFLRDTKYAGAHIEYFNNLVGPNGEPVNAQRLGSCCGFEDSSLPFGGGMLDRYQLTYDGQDKPVVIYVNLYKFEQPRAPLGFALL